LNDTSTSQDKLVELQDDTIALHAVINRLRDEQGKPVKSNIGGIQSDFPTKVCTMSGLTQHSFDRERIGGKAFLSGKTLERKAGGTLTATSLTTYTTRLLTIHTMLFDKWDSRQSAGNLVQAQPDLIEVDG
jgi:hypothetical protein